MPPAKLPESGRSAPEDCDSCRPPLRKPHAIYGSSEKQ
jgi:hypothetical protein